LAVKKKTKPKSKKKKKIIKPPATVISPRLDRRTITTMRMPDGLLSRLTTQAVKEGRSRSNLIEQVLTQYVEGLGDEQSIFG
jgi:predicted HicB family RNase H-like nuclease